MRTRRVLEGMNATLVGMSATLAEISERLAGMDARTAEISESLQRMNATMDREFKLTRASVENNTRVTREIVLELREHRPILEHIDHGVQSNTKGLLHLLDELRNGGGEPGPAPAA
jgi:chromosome segregation ATPase